MKPKLQTAAAWACAAAAMAFFLAPEGNPDIFWHLSVGREMFASRAIPRADSLSFTLAGAPWVDFEWGFQALCYPFYAAAGFAGLLALRLALWGGLLALLWSALGVYGLGRAVKGLGLLFFGILFSRTGGLRARQPQLSLLDTDLEGGGALAYQLVKEGLEGKPARSLTLAWSPVPKGGTLAKAS